MLMLMCSSLTALAVDYALGGYLNEKDVNSYDSSWKMTASGDVYTITKTFSTTDNYFWVFDSNGTKYGVSSYTELNPTTLVQNGGEKVGAKGLSTSSATTVTFNASTKQISWTTSGGGTGNLKEPYVISVYIQDQWDEQYTFTPVPGSTNYEYEVLVEIPDYTGNPADYKYWVGEEGKWKNGQSNNYNLGSRNNADDDYLASCETGVFRAKIYALQENGQAHGEARNYYIHDMSCGEHGAKISLASDVREFDLSEPPTSITLTATADEKSEGNYIWYKSDDEGATYTKITETTGNSYTLTGSEIPSGDRNYYKVTRKVVDSDDFISAICVIYTVQSCGKNTKGSIVFREGFGELTAVRGAGSRASFDGIVDGYTYQPASYKINDGYYAVVADPYYCGCGDGKNMSESVTDDCLANGVWFRQLRDHTLMNNGTTAPFGGMLMINFNGKGIAYQRDLTAEEKASITKNSILKFSAYFASAAVKSKQDVTFNPINMELKIQFKETGSSTWEDVAVVHSEVNHDEGWQRSEVEWTVDDADGDFRVVINNNGATGYGNDLLIDDIGLDLCTPSFSVYFYDEDDNVFEELEASNVEETAPIRVKQVDFGSLGNEPCIQLYKRTIEGTDTSYVYISELALDNASGYYYAEPALSDLLEEVPSSTELVAVASVKAAGACDLDIIKGVENGDYTVGKQTNVVFSNNYLTYSISCGTSVLTLAPGEETDICYLSDMVLPKLKLTSTNITTSVKMDILVDDTAILTDIPYAQDINISELYKAKNGEDYLPAIGERKITVKVREYFNSAVVCERFAQGEVTIEVKGNSAAPIGNRPGEHYSYNMCKTENEEEGKETDPDVIDNKYFFTDLLLVGEDKEGLVWLDKDGNIIPEENAFFYADQVQDDSVRVYRYPAGTCPSDTTTIYYRVKAFTPKPIFTKDYKECALGESAELIELKSLIDVEKSFENFSDGTQTSYKYIDFINKETNEIETTFDPKVPGIREYSVKVSLDEKDSEANDFCESVADYTVQVKGYATAANILANDTLVCPKAQLILKAKPDFDKEQKNVKYTWYSDSTITRRTLAYGETFKYYALDEAYKENPDTVYVTVQSDDYCENIRSEAKPVIISQKEAVPSLEITPTSAEVGIGAIPEFKVTPEDAKYDLYVNDVKVSDDATTYKPYIDSEYKLVYQGECGTSTASANVTVLWPTVFTPHLVDGRNDTFVKDMDPNFKTKIFTRFGTKVCESDNGWDGSVEGALNGGSGKKAVPGVYYYVVELPDGNVKKGTIEVFKY